MRGLRVCSGMSDVRSELPVTVSVVTTSRLRAVRSIVSIPRVWRGRRETHMASAG